MLYYRSYVRLLRGIMIDSNAKAEIQRDKIEIIPAPPKRSNAHDSRTTRLMLRNIVGSFWRVDAVRYYISASGYPLAT